jgi:hypothetical protein
MLSRKQEKMSKMRETSFNSLNEEMKNGLENGMYDLKKKLVQKRI